jgi:hypothetical protein
MFLIDYKVGLNGNDNCIMFANTSRRATTFAFFHDAGLDIYYYEDYEEVIGHPHDMTSQDNIWLAS